MSGEILYKRTGPMVVGAITILMTLLGWYTTVPIFVDANDYIMTIVPKMSALSFVLGSLWAIRHLVLRMQRGKTTLAYVSGGYSLALVGLFLVVGYAYGDRSSEFNLILDHLYRPGAAMVTAMQAFSWLEGMWYGFRIRRLESALLFVGCIVTLFAGSPFGEAVLPFVGPLGSWLLDVPVTAGSRGILMTSALGALLVGTRMLIGKERTLQV